MTPMSAHDRIHPVRSHILLALAMVLPSLSLAQTGPTAANQDPLQDLLQVLEEETEIATKTKLNIDFVPGMVSVLHARELQRRGIETVVEALELVPGIQLSMAGAGQNQVIMRGTGKIFASSNIKYMVNGIQLNSTLNAQSAIYEIPIEQVERIEVIRGPGSSIYGEFGFAGVVNVITVSDRDYAFVRHSSHNYSSVGGNAHFDQGDDGWSVDINVAASGASGGTVVSGPDKVSAPNVSYAPGPSNEKQRSHSVILNGSYKDFEFQAHQIESAQGDAFGVNNILPPPEQRLVRTIHTRTLQLGWGKELSPHFTFDGKVGYQHLIFDADRISVFPAGFMVPNPSPPPAAAVYPYGAFGSPRHRERKLYAGGELSFDPNPRQALLLGVEGARVRQTEASVARNYDPTAPWTGPMPVQRYTGSKSWIKNGLQRDFVGAYGQYQYRIMQPLTVTLGMRYDYYDDIGDAVSPRLAAVYRVSDRQTIKYQFARAFRPPTFLEMFGQNNIRIIGNPDIKPEKLTSHELGYIYNDGKTIFRLTAFHIDVEDLIQALNGSPGTYSNQHPPPWVGGEAQLEMRVHRLLEVDANVSYLDTTADATDIQAGIARVLGNVGLVLHPREGWNIGLQYRHVGERLRSSSDTRDPLKGYDVIDLTFNMEHIHDRGLTVRVGVNNLFDETVRYAAPAGTYPEDYPRPGRAAWVQWAYQF